jgi:hypothetical protein
VQGGAEEPAKATTLSAPPFPYSFNARSIFSMGTKAQQSKTRYAFHLLKQLIIKHGQHRHNDALETLQKELEEGYTVVGIYGDNQQPWRLRSGSVWKKSTRETTTRIAWTFSSPRISRKCAATV